MSLAAPSLERAADFIWRNARILERVLFSRLFATGSADAVVAAVRAYRNPDGGFGHAAEPDVRGPDSMPLHTEIALRALVAAGARDADLASGACEFLASVAEPTARVPIVLPAVRDYPHAPHWDRPSFTGDSINPTGALVGLLRAQQAANDWLERATAWCWARLEKPIEEAHEIASALTFLEHASDRDRATKASEKIIAEVEGASFYIKDPESQRYGLTPLDLCPTPEAIGRCFFDDGLIEHHLLALASQQQEDGGWPITFEAPSPGAVCEWRGRWTLAALSTLRAYKRL